MSVQVFNLHLSLKGDSGGPLAYMDSHNIWRHIGIASFVGGSGCVGAPNVFVRTTAYFDWMAAKIGQGIDNFSSL
jgi:secreted trypsin-like serine protease